MYLLIQQGVERYRHRVHGFCCMTNPIHLAIQVAEEPLSRIMQNLPFRHTRWINKKESRTGHLLQGRYKAILIDADSYLPLLKAVNCEIQGQQSLKRYLQFIMR